MRGAISETRSATPSSRATGSTRGAASGPGLVAGSEEVEVKPLVQRRTTLPQQAHRAQQGAEHLEPERQECPDVAEVDRAVGGVEIRIGTGLSPQAIEVRRLPAHGNDGARDRAQLRIAAPECVTGHARDGRDRVGGPDGPRLEAPREGARQPALDVGPAVRPRADGLAPGPHPGVLIVEDERHAEPPLEHRPEQRRVRRVDRDEQGVEALPSQQGPRTRAEGHRRPAARDPRRRCAASTARARHGSGRLEARRERGSPGRDRAAPRSREDPP